MEHCSKRGATRRDVPRHVVPRDTAPRQEVVSAGKKPSLAIEIQSDIFRRFSQVARIRE